MKLSYHEKVVFYLELEDQAQIDVDQIFQAYRTLNHTAFAHGMMYFSCCFILCRLSMNVMTLTIESTGVYTQLGVAVDVTGIAQVLISGEGYNQSIGVRN